MAQKRWSVLAMLLLVRTGMALQFQTVGSLAPKLIEDLAIDYGLLGTLLGLYMLPGIVIALPGGVLMARFGARAMALTGLAGMMLGGVVMGASTGFGTMAIGRLVSGTGAVFLNIALTKMVADWFAGREIVTAMSLLASSWPLGIALGLIVFVPMAEYAGWQAVMYAAAAYVGGGIVVTVFYRSAPDAAPASAATLALNLTRREWLLVSLAGLAWAAFNVAYIVLVSFAPELLVVRGYSLTQASWLLSIIGWVMIVTIPLSGFLAEQSGRPTAFTIAGLGVSAFAIVLLPFVTAPVIVLVVIALAVGLPAGPLFALPAQVLRPESRASGMG